MKKPSNRKERIEFLMKKWGYDIVSGFVAYTDSEIKRLFEQHYSSLKNADDYVIKSYAPTCVKCGDEISVTYDCACEHVFFLEEDWQNYIENCVKDGHEDYLDEQDIEFINNGYKISEEN